LGNFIAQNQASISDLNNQLKNLQQDLLQLKNDIETTFKEIKTESKKGQNLLAKWISGANSQLVIEQINQKQIDLTNQVQKISDSFSQLSQNIDDGLSSFIASSQQIMADFKNVENQLQMALQTSDKTNAASQGNAYAQLQLSIKQAIDALEEARRGIQQQRVYGEINQSIDNILQ
jgi:predicted  nucleic acid-binding Zn-ribbon protein